MHEFMLGRTQQPTGKRKKGRRTKERLKWVRKTEKGKEVGEFQKSVEWRQIVSLGEECVHFKVRERCV